MTCIPNGSPASEKPKPVALRIEDGRKMNKEWLVRVREVADRDQADLWRGRYLLVDTARIPEPDEDEVYVFSLLEVETATGRPLVPWHPGIVERVDEAARVIVLKPLEGLLG